MKSARTDIQAGAMTQPARFTKRRALEVLDDRADRIATRNHFNRSHGTAQLRNGADLDAMIARAVEYGRMRAFEQFAEAIEEGFHFEAPGAEHAPAIPEGVAPVCDLLVQFNRVTLSFSDNAAAHAFAGPFVSSLTGALLSGAPKLPVPSGSALADMLSSLAMQADAASNLGGDRHMKVTLGDISEQLLALAGQPHLEWVAIATAPKDGSVILVDDTNGGTPWAAAKWVAGDEWSGWAYDDEIMGDTLPMGPNPTRWLKGLSAAAVGEMLQAASS